MNPFFQGVMSDYQDEVPFEPVREVSPTPQPASIPSAISLPYEAAGPTNEAPLPPSAEARMYEEALTTNERPLPRKPVPVQAVSKKEFNHDNSKAIDDNAKKDELAQRSRERVGEDATNLYYALVGSETGGEDDPYIRTKYRDAPGGSSAFGPAQTTVKLLKGYKKKHSGIFDKDEKVFLDRMIRQGNKFLKHGNMKGKMKNYDERFDYGGKGDLIESEVDKEMYDRVVMKMVKQHLKDADGDMEEAARTWRWGPNHKGKVDERYMKGVSETLGVEFKQ